MSLSETRLPGFLTMKARGSSPASRSGTPTTPTSSTPGWLMSRPSSSAGATWWWSEDEIHAHPGTHTHAHAHTHTHEPRTQTRALDLRLWPNEPTEMGTAPRPSPILNAATVPGIPCTWWVPWSGPRCRSSPGRHGNPRRLETEQHGWTHVVSRRHWPTYPYTRSYTHVLNTRFEKPCWLWMGHMSSDVSCEQKS